METKNLWGNLDLDVPLRTPATVLKEQANMLSSITNGVLSGDVRVSQTSKAFLTEMYIVAPAINNYEINILDIESDSLVGLYPVIVRPQLGESDQGIECQNEEELTTVLEGILGSKRIKQAIRSLVAQSKVVSSRQNSGFIPFRSQAI